MKTVKLPRFAPIPAHKAEQAAAVKAAEEAKARPVVVVVDKATDIFDATHPANPAFMAWLNGKPATKRKAREFCRKMHTQRAA